MMRQPEDLSDNDRDLHRAQERVDSDSAGLLDGASDFVSLRCIRRLVRIYCDTMYQC
jgi:hypothetical protein